MRALVAMIGVSGSSAAPTPSHAQGVETLVLVVLRKCRDGNEIWTESSLLAPGAPLDRPGETERAVRELAGDLRMDVTTIRGELERGDRLDFNDSTLFQRVFALAESRAGKSLTRAMGFTRASSFSGP